MIKAKDAIRIARSLIGTPYSELDCINLIKKVIRSAPGGVKTYTTAGTNALWRSYDMSAKYKDLTWRQEGLAGAQAGMIAFKADGEDYHHAGIVTDAGTVIHSSSTQGGRGVVETPLTAKEGWTHLSIHRYIETLESGGKPGEEKVTMDNGIVRTQGGKLNMRQSPDGALVKQIENGTAIEILSTDGEWLGIRLEDGSEGFVHASYVERKAETGEKLRIVDEAGRVFLPQGSFTVTVEQQ